MRTQGDLKTEAIRVAKRIRDARLGEEYHLDPFQHVVLDNFFSDDLAVACLKSFPALDDPTWEVSNLQDIEIKARTTWQDEFDIPQGIVDAVRILNSATVLRAMSERFSIPKLMADPYFTGGGLNATPLGGLLDVHVDGNYHDASGMHRRMNALLYLNPNYTSDWGGQFGMYGDDGRTLIKSVEPIYNRLVIFDSHDKSFHGLPNPVRFPAEEPRRSIILYYYTVASRPSEQIVIDAPHSALWVKKNLRDKLGNQTRDYL